MLPRSLVISLCALFAALGAWAGFQYFEQALAFLNTGSVSLMVKYHTDAQQLARTSFTVAAGLLAGSIPLAALMAGRFRKRAYYLEPLVLNSLISLTISTAALLYYRNEMQSLGLKVGEFLSLVRDSKREIALNPLTRSLLFGTTLTLLAGLVRGLMSPLKGKK